jgi:hypothetical protein
MTSLTEIRRLILPPVTAFCKIDAWRWGPDALDPARSRGPTNGEFLSSRHMSRAKKRLLDRLPAAGDHGGGGGRGHRRDRALLRPRDATCRSQPDPSFATAKASPANPALP